MNVIVESDYEMLDDDTLFDQKVDGHYKIGLEEEMVQGEKWGVSNEVNYELSKEEMQSNYSSEELHSPCNYNDERWPELNAFKERTFC